MPDPPAADRRDTTTLLRHIRRAVDAERDRGPGEEMYVIAERAGALAEDVARLDWKLRHGSELPTDWRYRFSPQVDPLDGYVQVSFVWSVEHGVCFECSCPAAFLVHGVYGDDQPSMPACAVCAANNAVDGHTITRIDGEAG